MAKKDELNFENGNNMAGSEKLKALQAAMDKIEKSFGKGSIMKMGDESVEQVEVIPTGSIGLNVALGVGGYPRGRIIEIYGPESSGKTTLAIHAIAELFHQLFVCVCNQGEGQVVLFDEFLVEQFGVWGEKSMYGRKYMGTFRTTFIINEEGVIERIITPKEVKTKDHAAQIL